MTSPTQLSPLSIADLIRAGQFTTAVERMQSLVRLGDPTEPVDVDAIRARYEASRAHLRSVVPPEPFRVVVELVGGNR
jgi:hypothetical protein